MESQAIPLLFISQEPVETSDQSVIRQHATALHAMLEREAADRHLPPQVRLVHDGRERRLGIGEAVEPDALLPIMMREFECRWRMIFPQLGASGLRLTTSSHSILGLSVVTPPQAPMGVILPIYAHVARTIGERHFDLFEMVRDALLDIAPTSGRDDPPDVSEES